MSAPAFGCVDLGGTRIRSAVAREPRRIEARDDRDTPRDGPEGVVRAIVASLREVSPDLATLSAVGVSAPGPLDHRTGVVHEAPNIPGFIDVPLAAELSEALGRPVFVDRDTFVAAMGEASVGAARGSRHFVFLTISTGIGGAIVSDGRLLRGATGTAGEIGHWPVEGDGPPCGCGGRGCVESIASGSGVARLYGTSDAAAVYAAAREGEERARAIVDRALRALGDLAVGIVNTLNPERIVVGGGVALGEHELIFGAMRQAVRQRAFRVPAEAVRIVPAELGDDVSLVGAFLMAREREAGRDPLS